MCGWSRVVESGTTSGPAEFRHRAIAGLQLGVLNDFLTHQSAILPHSGIDEPHAVMAFVDVAPDIKDRKLLLCIGRILNGWQRQSERLTACAPGILPGLITAGRGSRRLDEN